MDKASVLGDAIKYVKELQERLKTLEEEATKKTVEPVVLLKRFHVYRNDDVVNSCYDQLIPGLVEARVLDKDVLLRIHCKKDVRGCLVNMLSQVEKLHLTIINTSVLQFGNSSIDITMVAQVRKMSTVPSNSLDIIIRSL